MPFCIGVCLLNIPAIYRIQIMRHISVIITGDNTDKNVGFISALTPLRKV